MIGWRRMIGFSFSKITRKQVIDSSYDRLIDRIANQYGNQEYQIPSTLSLLEVHHLYRVFKPGDCVLDIGAGPYWSWSKLALKLTQNPQKSHLLISNDLLEDPVKRENAINVRGDFLAQPTQTKIAMNLLQRQLDSILIDATPEYSGNQEIDSRYTMGIFYQALLFSDKYLKKGGSIVMRAIQSVDTKMNEQKSKLFFKEVYRHKPSNIPSNYYSSFYIFKGFNMVSGAKEIQNFLKQYHRAPYKKRQSIVQICKEKYSWDPVTILNNQAKIRISQLKDKGHKNSQIAKIYEKDNFVKTKQICTLLDTINDSKASPAAQIKAKQKLYYGKNITNPRLLPQNEDEFTESFIYFMDKLKEKETKKKPAEENKPLNDDEIYMKQIKDDDQFDEDLPYLEKDLLGFAPQDSEEQTNPEIEEQSLQKILDSLPAMKGYYDPNDKQKKQQLLSIFKQSLHKTRGQTLNEMKNRQKGEEISDDERQVLKMLSEDEYKGKSSHKRKFDFIQEQFDEKDAFIKGEENIREQDKQEYMESKPKKADRYVNQRRSKRKHSNPKF